MKNNQDKLSQIAEEHQGRRCTQDEHEMLKCVECWRNPDWFLGRKYYCSEHYQKELELNKDSDER